MKQIEQMIKKILRHWFSQWHRLGVLSIKTRDDTKHNRTWVEKKALLRHVGGYYFVCQTYVSFLQYTCNTKRIDKCRRQYSVWVQVKRKLWKHPPDMKKNIWEVCPQLCAENDLNTQIESLTYNIRFSSIRNRRIKRFHCQSTDGSECLNVSFDSLF